MNTLRILSVVCGAVGIKRLGPLLTLLLLWPAFASANCSPAQTCVVTSGTLVVDSPIGPFPLNFAGKNFSASGVLAELVGILPYGLLFNSNSDPFVEGFGGTVTQNLLAQFQLTVNGVPWGIPADGDAGISFSAELGIIDTDGTFSRPFDFSASFKGAPEPFAPGLGCDMLNCETLKFFGNGIVTYDVEEFVLSGVSWFEVGKQTFSFQVVPEPATLPLFALGLVGLTIRRKAVGPLLAGGNGRW